MVEIVFPRLVRGSPAFSIFLKAVIAFDYFTDLPLVWASVYDTTDPLDVTKSTGWSISEGYAQLPAQVVAAGIMTVITSLVLQVIIVLIGYTLIRIF